MIKSSVLILGMLLFFQLVSAQVQLEYGSGYVVLAKNDTLYGQIRKAPYNTYLTKIYFKEKNSTTDKIYTPYELNCFHYDPDVTMESVEVRSVNEKDTTYKWRFALRRLSGPVELLLLYSRNGEARYFVQNKAFGLSELTNPIETIHDQIFRNNKYLTILAKYTNEVPGFQDRIRNSTFDEESLVALISDYNRNFGRVPETKPLLTSSRNVLVNAGQFVSEQNKSQGFNLGLEYTLSIPGSYLKSEIVYGFNFKHIQKIQSANLVGVPIFWRINDRMSLVSPGFELGFEPFLYQETYHSKLSINIAPILGLGIGLNYQRLRLEYMFFVNQSIGQGFTLQYQLQ